MNEDQMNKISEPLMEIDFPKADGARYRCQAIIQVSPPIYWDDCPETATKACKGMNTHRKYLRCSKHYPLVAGV